MKTSKANSDSALVSVGIDLDGISNEAISSSATGSGSSNISTSDYLRSGMTESSLESNSEMYEGKENPEEKGKKKGFIFLHGVMGSRLYAGEQFEYEYKDSKNVTKKEVYHEGRCIWILSGWVMGSKTLFKKGQVAMDILQLSCDSDGKSKRVIETAGKNDREFGDDKNDSEYGATSFYTKIMNDLKKEYGDEDAMFLNYDWRFGIDTAATELKGEINTFAKKHDITYLVAHSMGGLVSCIYLKNLVDSSVKDKIRLITLGTPYYGAPQALYGFATGKLLPMNIAEATLFKIIKNIRSAYDLLPTKDYVDKYKYFVQINKSNNATVTEDFVKTNKFIDRNFNSTLRKEAETAHNDLKVKDVFNKHKFSCAIAGYGKSTIEKVNRISSKNGITYELEKTYRGDETVPLISSTMAGGIDKNRLLYINEGHGALAKNNEVIKFVKSKAGDWEDPTNAKPGYNVKRITSTIDAKYNI